jgi:hypothetical protein
MTPAASTVGLTQNVSVVVTMSEVVSGVTTSNLSPSCGSVTSVSGDNSTTLTFTVDVNGGGGAACTDGDTLTASFSTSGLTDAAGNTATGSESKAYTVDGVALELQTVVAAVVGGNIEMTLTFDDPPAIVSGQTLLPADFFASGLTCAVVNLSNTFSSSVSGNTLVVSFVNQGNCAGGDTFEIRFNNSAAQNKIGDAYENAPPTFTAPVTQFAENGVGLTLVLQ